VHIQSLQGFRKEALDRFAFLLIATLLEEKYIRPGIDMPVQDWIVTSGPSIIVIPAPFATPDDDLFMDLRKVLGLTPNDAFEVADHVTAQLHALGSVFRGVECYVSRTPATMGMFRKIRG
jgi:hypothetical protein